MYEGKIIGNRETVNAATASRWLTPHPSAEALRRPPGVEPISFEAQMANRCLGLVAEESVCITRTKYCIAHVSRQACTSEKWVERGGEKVSVRKDGGFGNGGFSGETDTNSCS